MPKIQRKTQKIFCNSADSDQLAVFGSMSTGTPVYSSDIEELQSNEAFDLGWDAATLEDKAPFMEEMNGVQYGLTYQIAYGLQEGIPEYDAATTYYIGSICKVLEDGKPVLYTSLTDNNIGNNPVNDSTNWERLSFGGGGLEIGDIGFTQMAIDETQGKRRKLNGQLIIQEQYPQFTNIVKNSVALNADLACTEEEWQTAVTMSTFGLCDKFVIDDEAGTIRLPKYPSYFIGGINGIAPVVGNGLALGLTNGTTNYGLGGIVYSNANNVAMTIAGYGAKVGTTAGSLPAYGNVNYGVTTDPTKSGIEAQIKQEKINGTYFIQVATGAETEDNIINEIELNNPFSLLDYKYSEYELNNLSWLRSEGQYNSKAIYPAVYDLLLKIYNGTETKAGVSVKLTTETFTDYDFVLNTAEETFRLPIKVKLASGKAVVGNGNMIGLTNGSSLVGITFNSNQTAHFGPTGALAEPLPVSSTNATLSAVPGVFGVTTDPNYSGIETSDSDLYLYFYVGETVQNANLINAGRIEEIKANKTDVDGQWVQSYLQIMKKTTAVGSYTYDLSDYLPNDGYSYEVMFGVYQNSTAETYFTVGTKESPYTNKTNCFYCALVSTATGSNVSQTFTLPIDTSRKVYLQISNKAITTTSFIDVIGYRRIGTNV